MPVIIAIVIGALVGAMSGDAFSALIGAIAGWLMIRSWQQQGRIAALQQALDALQRASSMVVQQRQVDVAGSADPVRSAEPMDDPSTLAQTVARKASPAAAGSLASEGGNIGGPDEVFASQVAEPRFMPPTATHRGVIDEATSLRSSAAAGLSSDRANGSVAAGVALATSAPPESESVGPSAAAAERAARQATPPLPPAADMFVPLKRWLFGGNTIVKAGIGILFVGLAFLAKYASEHVQVPIELRLASIAGVAIALLAIGWRLRLARPGYAQVLQGGAVAALYLTLFVAYRFYDVLALGPVFAMMVAVAALAAALAVLQDARALAVIGALGGFAAPILVSTGSGNHVALFGYCLVLDLGIAAVAWHRTWRSLNLVGFFGTFGVATAWGVLKYRPEDFATSEAFLLAFFVLFVAIMLMPARRLAASDRREAGDAAASENESAAAAKSAAASASVGRSAALSAALSVSPSARASIGASGLAATSDRWVNSSLLFGLPIVVFALQAGLVRDTEYGTALSALALAAVYVGLATWMRSRPRLGLTFDASIAIGTVFLTLVIPLALDARSTAGAWSAEAAALVWIGLRQRRWLARVFGYALLLLAGASMLFAHDRFGPPLQVFNAYLFNGLMGAAGSLAAAWFVRRHLDRVARTQGEPVVEPLLVAIGTLWLLSTAVVQIEVFVPDWYLVSVILATGSAITWLYSALEARLGWKTIGWPTLAHGPFMLLVLLGGYVFVDSPLSYGGWWAWPVAVLAHLAVLRWVTPQVPDAARRMVHAIGLLVVALFGALEGRSISADWGDAASAWPWLGWLVVPALLLLWLPRPASMRPWPMRAAPQAYRLLAGGIVAACLLAWTVIANFASDGSADPLPHVPFVNPLDIGVGIALVATMLWWRAVVGAASPRRRDAAALFVVVSFVWLNAVLVRGFHHYGGVPYRVQAWTGSLAVQTGITLLWTATALVAMWFAARRTERLPWMVGAGLLAAVVLKLLWVDLSGSGTVTRIVSFIGVGVLMLVIGYVAPLPSKDTHVLA